MKNLTVSGSFMLICPETRKEFNPGEVVKVDSLSYFMEERLASGDLVNVGDTGPVPEEPAPVPDTGPVPEEPEPAPLPEPEPVKPPRKGRK